MEMSGKHESLSGAVFLWLRITLLSIQVRLMIRLLRHDGVKPSGMWGHHVRFGKHWRRFKDTNNTKIWKNQERIQWSARLEEGQAQLPRTFVGCKLQHKATQGFQGIALSDASNNRLYGIVKRLLIKHIWVEADDFLPQILTQGETWVDHCLYQSKQEYGEKKEA